MTVQALADRCTELGMPIGRVAITKLENGAREKVSVAELLVLAAALKVPPALLIFPLGRADSVEALPGRQLTSWDATKWLSGDVRLQEEPDEPTARPASTTSAIPLYRQHDQLTIGLAGCTKEQALRRDETGHAVRQGVDWLREIRQSLRELDLDPPSLPARLAWIDELGC